MNESAAFIQGIVANPYDDTPRLAFANWTASMKSASTRGPTSPGTFIRRTKASNSAARAGLMGRVGNTLGRSSGGSVTVNPVEGS
jgi:uncharacterized protein (TIGR02996 family)